MTLVRACYLSFLFFFFFLGGDALRLPFQDTILARKNGFLHGVIESYIEITGRPQCRSAVWSALLSLLFYCMCIKLMRETFNFVIYKIYLYVCAHFVLYMCICVVLRHLVLKTGTRHAWM